MTSPNATDYHFHDYSILNLLLIKDDEDDDFCTLQAVAYINKTEPDFSFRLISHWKMDKIRKNPITDFAENRGFYLFKYEQIAIDTEGVMPEDVKIFFDVIRYSYKFTYNEKHFTLYLISELGFLPFQPIQFGPRTNFKNNS